MFPSRFTINVFAVVGILCFVTGCAGIAVRRPDVVLNKQADIPILLYHRIDQLPACATSAQRRWTLSPEKFEAQMRWVFEQGFHPVTLMQVSKHVKCGLPLPVKPIVISFDDGYKDQYNNAVPILKKYRIPATFFIITDSVGHSAYMNWDQVKELSDFGMDMESHTLTHTRLSNAPRQQAWQEIVNSKKILEKHLGKSVSILSYPYGSYGEDTIAMTRDAGYETAVTVKLNGGYIYRADTSYVISRYAVEGDEDSDSIARFLHSGKDPVCQFLFVSLVQDPSIFSSREAIDALLDFAQRAGITTLFVQVYRQNKAWFHSELADSSQYEKSLQALGEDPFAYMIRQAHQRGIQVHAWLNLLSLAQNHEARILKKYGTDILTRNVKEKKNLRDFLIDSQYFLEPGDPRIRGDLSAIVAELVREYSQLDGIQFDYIRYPDMEPHYGYTQSNVERFKKATGVSAIDEESRDWKNWKRVQVNELLTVLVQSARGVRPDIQISATGCMPYIRAYYEAYQDWPSWVNSGMVDFITVMDYSEDPHEFRRWLTVVRSMVDQPSKIKVGIGAYKFVAMPALFGREINYVKELGFTGAVFHYGSLLENPELQSIVIDKNNRTKKE